MKHFNSDKAFIPIICVHVNKASVAAAAALLLPDPSFHTELAFDNGHL